MKIVFRLSMVLFFTIFLVSCEESVEITKIEVIHNENEVIVLDDFDLSDLILRITYSDDKFMEVPLSESMLSLSDLSLLSSVGNHTIKVFYEGNETTVTIRLDYDTLTKQLRSFYTLSQTSNSFEGTYEEWLARIQGPAGEDGREVSFQVAGEYIQWRYTGDTVWTNLIELTTLIGPKGDDGVNGIDGREAVFQVHNNFIQWKYEGENVWTNLVSLETLTGEKGNDGLQVELRVSEGYIQWQYTGDTSWTNLIEISTLIGSSGSDGQTPFIGNNGNWWIGETDLGIFAGNETYVQEPFTEGLTFTQTFIDGKLAYTIPVYAYQGGNSKHIVIPRLFNGYEVKVISPFAFSEYISNLETVIIPDTITYISLYAFNSNNLKTLDLPDSITYIGRSAFSGNELSNVKLSEGLTTISESVFRDNLLTYISIPNGIRHIEANAFRNNLLTSIIIPENVIYIGDGAFADNPLENVIILGDETRFDDRWEAVGFPKKVIIGEQINLSYADWGNPELNQALIDAFMVEYPNIKVTLRSDIQGSGATFTGNLITSAQAGLLPDVFLTDNVPTVIYAGLALDVSLYWDADPDTQFVYDGVSATAIYNGKRFALPSYQYLKGIMINLDAFDKANLITTNNFRIDNDGYPVKDWTFDEFLAIASAIKDFNPNNYSSGYMLGLDTWFGMPDFQQVWPMMDDTTVGYDTWDGTRFNYASSESWKRAMTEKIELHALTDGTTTRFTAEFLEVNQTLNTYHILNGTVAMDIEGSWQFWVINEAARNGINLGFWPYPQGSAGFFPPTILDYVAVSSETDHPEEAYLLAKWMSFGKAGYSARLDVLEARNAIAVANGALPVLLDRFPVADYADVWVRVKDMVSEIEGIDYILDNIDQARPDLDKWLPGYKDFWAWVYDPENPYNFDNLVTQGADAVPTFATEWEKQINSIVQQALQSLIYNLGY